MRKILSKPLLLLTGLSLFAISILFAPGYFYGAHDGRHSVFYLIMFDASIRDGALWPRWAMHHSHGYGYPTFVIQAPLGFYLAEVFVLLGAGYTLAAKFAWAISFVVSGWGMYALVSHWLNERQEARGTVQEVTGQEGRREGAALVAALLYVFIPYHLANMVVRAALNDTLLFAWFPWVFLTFDRLLQQGVTPGWPRRLAFALLTLAGTLLTHTFVLISFAPLLVTFVLFRLTSLPNWRHLIGRIALAAAAGVGALLLAATFLIPLFAEGGNLQQKVFVSASYDFRNNFVYLGQFFSPFWGFGFSDDPVGANDSMGFQVGALALLFGIVALWQLRQAGRWRPLLVYLLLITVGLLLVMTPLSKPLWEAAPSLGVIQFPWRLLALVAFTLSALAGLTLFFMGDWLAGAVGQAGTAEAGQLLVGILIVFGSFGYVTTQLQPVEPWREDGRAIFAFEREHPDMLGYTHWVTQPYSTTPMTEEYASADYREDYSEQGFLSRLALLPDNGAGQVISNYSRGSSAGGVIRASTPVTVQINVAYFPGWQVTVDGAPVPSRISTPTGLIELTVPAGEHRIDARMGSTPARRLGTIISWGMVVVVVGLLLARRQRISGAN